LLDYTNKTISIINNIYVCFLCTYFCWSRTKELHIISALGLCYLLYSLYFNFLTENEGIGIQPLSRGYSHGMWW